MYVGINDNGTAVKAVYNKQTRMVDITEGAVKVSLSPGTFKEMARELDQDLWGVDE